MHIDISKNLFVLLLPAVLSFFPSCSMIYSEPLPESDSSSEVSTEAPHTTPAEESRPEETVKLTLNDVSIAEPEPGNCIVTMNSNKYHKGVELEDQAEIDRIKSFSEKVASEYEPFKDPLPEFSGGGFMKIRMPDGSYLYIPDMSLGYVRIGEVYYLTEKNETQELSAHIKGALEKGA